MNVDPINAGNAPKVDELLQYGYRRVRLVSRDSQAIRDYRDAVHAAGIAVLCAITEGSGGYVLPGCDVYQIGNEPDEYLSNHDLTARTSIWSGTGDCFTPQAYVEYWGLYYDNYFAPGKPLASIPVIGAGLGAGQVTWWIDVKNAGGLKGASGFAVHPYARSAASAASLLAAYRAITSTLPLYVTEWSRPLDETAQFAAMLRQAPGVVGHFKYTWGGADDSQFNTTPEQHRLISAFG